MKPGSISIDEAEMVKMKRIASLFLALFLLLGAAAFAEGPLQADLTEGSRLIGILLTREDLDMYTGGSGFLAASCREAYGEPEYIFPDVWGLRLLCFLVPDASGEGRRLVSWADDGFTAVDFDVNEDSGTVSMDADVSYVPGPEDALFFFNPVFLSLSGQVYAVRGDAMALSAEMNPPGSSVGQTLRDERKHTENGREITDVTTVGIRISAVREPAEIRILQFSEGHQLLQSEAFLPGRVPEAIVPLPDAEYLLIETAEKDGTGGLSIRRDIAGRDQDYLNTFSSGDFGICLSHYHEVRWK